MGKINYRQIEDALKTKLKDSTVALYIQNSKRLFRHAFDTETPTTEELASKKGYKQLIDTLSSDKYKTANARKVSLATITHIYAIYDLDTDALTEKYKEWNRLANAESVKSKANVKGLNDFDFKYFKKRAEEISQDPDAKLIGFLYTMMPPLRPNEWIDLPIRNDKSKTNHINLKKGILYIYDHKTSGTGGEKIIKLSRPLLTKIKQYVETTGNDRLLPITYPQFRTKFTRLFVKTPTFLRKAYVTQNLPKLNATELADMSRIMGHQIGTALVSYNKGTTRAASPELQPE